MTLPLTTHALQNFVAGFPDEITVDFGKCQSSLCMYVLQHFLGAEWCKTHVLYATKGFLWIDFSHHIRREKASLKFFELSENVFNLQNVDGFCECISRLKTGNIDSPQIESTYAELEFGRLLFFHDISFRFVTREQKKGSDYDFLIIYPNGTTAFADAKCKLEGKEPNKNSVTRSLKKARNQLPKQGPGIVFVKIPQEWAENDATRNMLRDAAAEFLRGTGRIASITYYSPFVTFPDTQSILRRYAFMEISNPQSRVGANLKWDLFTRPIPSSWGGKHPKWVELSAIANEVYEYRDAPLVLQHTLKS